jgi:hypothetical protein
MLPRAQVLAGTHPIDNHMDAPAQPLLDRPEVGAVDYIRMKAKAPGIDQIPAGRAADLARLACPYQAPLADIDAKI